MASPHGTSWPLSQITRSTGLFSCTDTTVSRVWGRKVMPPSKKTCHLGPANGYFKVRNNAPCHPSESVHEPTPQELDPGHEPQRPALQGPGHLGSDLDPRPKPALSPAPGNLRRSTMTGRARSRGNRARPGQPARTPTRAEDLRRPPIGRPSRREAFRPRGPGRMSWNTPAP